MSGLDAAGLLIGDKEYSHACMQLSSVLPQHPQLSLRTKFWKLARTHVYTSTHTPILSSGTSHHGFPAPSACRVAARGLQISGLGFPFTPVGSGLTRALFAAAAGLRLCDCGWRDERVGCCESTYGGPGRYVFSSSDCWWVERLADAAVSSQCARD